MTLRLSQWVTPNAIQVGASPKDRAGLIAEVASLAHRVVPHLGTLVVREALLEREELAPTGIGDGVALPHGKVPGIDEPVTLLVVVSRGVDFGAPDGRPVEVALALLNPLSGADPLKTLAKLSRPLRDPVVRRRLIGAATPEEAWEVLKAHERDRSS